MLYTVAEAASRLTVSQRTLRSIIKAGRLPVIYVSPGSQRITADAIADYLDNNTVPAQTRSTRTVTDDVYDEAAISAA